MSKQASKVKEEREKKNIAEYVYPERETNRRKKGKRDGPLKKRGR